MIIRIYTNPKHWKQEEKIIYKIPAEHAAARGATPPMWQGSPTNNSARDLK
jgi:hypothetical protein